jgi:hypothetical protein
MKGARPKAQRLKRKGVEGSRVRGKKEVGSWQFAKSRVQDTRKQEKSIEC